MAVYRFKTTCSAFGCERYTRRIDSPRGIFLCPGHWPLVSKRLRSLFNKSYRAMERDPSEKNIRRAARCWARCVKAANNAQFGI